MSLRKGCPQRRLRGDVPKVRLSPGSVCLSPAPEVTHGEGGGGVGLSLSVRLSPSSVHLSPTEGCP